VERTLGPEKLVGLEKHGLEKYGLKRHGLELEMNKHQSVEKQ
tara:strand:- start:323 stop:448 length:126 start_codon:yes stop_codon:yes gene_type:complete